MLWWVGVGKRGRETWVGVVGVVVREMGWSWWGLRGERCEGVLARGLEGVSGGEIGVISSDL